eukprot:CAMPEP_0206231854 /NCGR_PEP_ID=MMETSP0047_2-20121206/11074_1 /ASSEMBLY_ACC=CAM_ASM_000192 /TAXON_ID=195065 /ORGANISM="Chroomonas mesostigmatica_cf, Strain CCMP1168" /LENGTH=155 /DNA_ID=CAMNT_0053655491 /DNA_START=53 /DNA_END=521 /DNA_ORIENTATION=-
MSDRKAVVKNADMSEDMQQDAIDCAAQAMEKYNIEKDIAAYIKKEFDKKYNPTWHCIVGRNFGSYVTHETKHFIYFYLGQVAILLFKSGNALASAKAESPSVDRRWLQAAHRRRLEAQTGDISKVAREASRAPRAWGRGANHGGRGLGGAPVGRM